MTKTSHDSETPAHGRQLFSATALIHKQMDGVPHIFLAKRADTKKFLPSVYEIVGGHINYGEDMIAGLQREVAEELAVQIKVGDPFYVYTYQNLVKGSHTIEVVYFATLAEPESHIHIEPEDHSEYGWFTEEQVQTLIAANRAAVVQLDSIDIDSDHELLAMLKGLRLLGGEPLDFAV